MNNKTLQFSSQQLEGEYFREYVQKSTFNRKILLVTTGIQALGYTIFSIINQQFTFSMLLFGSLFIISTIIYLIMWFNMRLFNWLLLVRSVFMITLIYILYIKLGLPELQLSGGQQNHDDSNNTAAQEATETSSSWPTFKPTQLLYSFSLILEYTLNVQGTIFLIKAFQHFYAYIMLVMTFFDEENSDVFLSLSTFLLVPYFLLLIIMEYMQERQARSFFLSNKQNTELQFLLDKIVPMNLVVAKYNHREQHVELHNSNRKSRNNLLIKDGDSFKQFCKKVMLKSNSNTNNESISDQVDRSFRCLSKSISQNNNTLFSYLEQLANYSSQKIRVKGKVEKQSSIKQQILQQQQHQLQQPQQNLQKKITDNTYRITVTFQNQVNEDISQSFNKISSPGNNNNNNVAVIKKNVSMILQPTTKPLENAKATKRRISNLNLKDYASQGLYDKDCLERVKLCQGEYQQDNFSPKRQLDIKIYVFNTTELFMYVIIEDQTLQQQIDIQAKYIKAQQVMINNLFDEVRVSISQGLQQIYKLQSIQKKQSPTNNNNTRSSFSQKVGKIGAKRNSRSSISRSYSQMSGFTTLSTQPSSCMDQHSQENYEKMQDLINKEQQIQLANSMLQNYKYEGYRLLNSLYSYFDYQDLCKNTVNLNVQTIKLSKIISDIRDVIEGELEKHEITFQIINQIGVPSSSVFNSSKRIAIESEAILLQMGEESKQQQQQQQPLTQPQSLTQTQTQTQVQSPIIQQNQQYQQTINEIEINSNTRDDDTLVTDERRLKMVLLSILFQCIKNVNKGHIILRITRTSKLHNTIKFQIIDTGNSSIFIDDFSNRGSDLEFRQGSIEDMGAYVLHGSMKFALQVSRRIVGQIGPLINIKCLENQHKKGSNISFKIYQNLKQHEQTIKSLQFNKELSNKLSFTGRHSEDLSDESDQEIHQVAFQQSLLESISIPKKSPSLSQLKKQENRFASFYVKSERQVPPQEQITVNDPMTIQPSLNIIYE